MVQRDLRLMDLVCHVIANHAARLSGSFMPTTISE